MSSGWWMTDLLGLQDHVALSSHQVNRDSSPKSFRFKLHE